MSFLDISYFFHLLSVDLYTLKFQSNVFFVCFSFFGKALNTESFNRKKAPNTNDVHLLNHLFL